MEEKIVLSKQIVEDIGTAIVEASRDPRRYTPAEMPDAIRAIGRIQHESIQRLTEGQERLSRMSAQTMAAARAYLRSAPAVPDAEALQMPDLFPAWEEVLEAGEPLQADRIISKDGRLYRVVQAVTPQEHQPPDADGMLAVYRPIDRGHSGAVNDPIPWVSGMDCTSGLHYAYEGKLWLCKGDMKPCVWAPGSPGVWQWAEVT